MGKGKEDSSASGAREKPLVGGEPDRDFNFAVLNIEHDRLVTEIRELAKDHTLPHEEWEKKGRDLIDRLHKNEQAIRWIREERQLADDGPPSLQLDHLFDSPSEPPPKYDITKDLTPPAHPKPRAQRSSKKTTRAPHPKKAAPGPPVTLPDPGAGETVPVDGQKMSPVPPAKPVPVPPPRPQPTINPTSAIQLVDTGATSPVPVQLVGGPGGMPLIPEADPDAPLPGDSCAQLRWKLDHARTRLESAETDQRYRQERLRALKDMPLSADDDDAEQDGNLVVLFRALVQELELAVAGCEDHQASEPPARFGADPMAPWAPAPADVDTGHYDDGHSLPWRRPAATAKPSPAGFLSGGRRSWLMAIVATVIAAVIATIAFAVGAPGKRALGSPVAGAQAAPSESAPAAGPATLTVQRVPEDGKFPSLDYGTCIGTFTASWLIQGPPGVLDGQTAVAKGTGPGLDGTYTATVGHDQVTFVEKVPGSAWGAHAPPDCLPETAVSFSMDLVSIGGYQAVPPNQLVKK